MEHGPYLLNVTDEGFTVVWSSTADAAGWVELAPDDGSHFYAAERPKFRDSHLGRQRIGRMHSVRVSGLKPGTTYRYRIMQRDVVLNEGNKRVILDEGFGSDILEHKTPTPSRHSIRRRRRSISGSSTTSIRATRSSAC